MPLLAFKVSFVELGVGFWTVCTLCSRKQMSQLESEKRYLEKSNKHLENILEATNAYKNQEVSELNRIHFETIKVSHCEASALYSVSFFPCLADFFSHC